MLRSPATYFAVPCPNRLRDVDHRFPQHDQVVADRVVPSSFRDERLVVEASRILEDSLAAPDHVVDVAAPLSLRPRFRH